MVETRDLVQLRQLSLELLGQLWAGQEAVRRSVAKAASASNLDSSSSYDSETPSSQEMSSAAPRASCPQDAHQDSNDPALSAELDGLPQEAQALRSVPDQQSKLPKARVTFKKESPVPEGVWRFRPYLGYDWIAGSLDSSSPVTSKPEAFFSKLQKFREANKEECICSEPDPQVLSLHENGGVEGDHECVYCYRVSRRLFLVPSDPGSPCRLCRAPRGQRGPETLAEPAQVRVSVPLSILDPPHKYHIHRRKSFDASDTLALPRHCLLGWDILPPKSEKSSAPESLGLWSCVSSKAQHRKLSAASPSHLALPTWVPPPTRIWSESQVPRPCTPELKPRGLATWRRTVPLPSSLASPLWQGHPREGIPARPQLEVNSGPPS